MIRETDWDGQILPTVPRFCNSPLAKEMGKLKPWGPLHLRTGESFAGQMLGHCLAIKSEIATFEVPVAR